MKGEIKKTLFDFLFYILGCVIFSSAVVMFISPNKISPGGITGIATALEYLFNVPAGLTIFILNMPILLLGLKKIGKLFILRTAFVTVILSLSMSLAEAVLPEFYIDNILASLFGGIFMGLGLSLIILRGATTGGVDILAKLINRKFRHLTVGRLILIMDAFVIAVAVITYRNVESALYSAVAMYATSVVMDKILYGSDAGKGVYILTEKPKEVCRDIMSTLGRGVTVISARGGYTGDAKEMLFCVVRRHEVSTIYSILDIHDKGAFIVISEVGEIVGEGFKRMI